MKFDRFLFVAAALCGAAGVALSAAASHGGSTNVATAANFLLFHAPVLIALSLVAARILHIGAAVLLLSVLLFSGDLLARDYLGQRLFPFAAPLGGTGMILGWLTLAVGGLLARKDS
ncbi:uncharacterized membrane protein YgdD (TMEM256/DUF423 family) [Aminobacter aminovorans]|uniref:Protein of uncharacterized function (DUF423) n=1 Tax=Aminobacter aminovorans TaxID=83263 RepID=A0A380WF53_AMIAI|nr:DUF423 domain-containing protein [Aminobacter aminovorans]TCS21696.1 uncharacterized membrane protein YgdD (TMEM256/DUF423 family) [Aminobacter aminovorans]SUU87560.1 Protein of uncharacterised function (DUF423) [Aminobacter aminovorans]